jgi:hypothetical protein
MDGLAVAFSGEARCSVSSLAIQFDRNLCLLGILLNARDLGPVVVDIRAGGATSMWALEARGMRTRRGGRWHVSIVTALIKRLGARRARARV